MKAGVPPENRQHSRQRCRDQASQRATEPNRVRVATSPSHTPSSHVPPAAQGARPVASTGSSSGCACPAAGSLAPTTRPTNTPGLTTRRPTIPSPYRWARVHVRAGVTCTDAPREVIPPEIATSRRWRVRRRHTACHDLTDPGRVRAGLRRSPPDPKRAKSEQPESPNWPGRFTQGAPPRRSGAVGENPEPVSPQPHWVARASPARTSMHGQPRALTAAIRAPENPRQTPERALPAPVTDDVAGRQKHSHRERQRSRSQGTHLLHVGSNNRQ